MVDEEFVALHLGRGDGADVEAVGDLDVRARDPTLHARERGPVEDVATLDGDDLALADRPPREESPALDGARPNDRLGGQVGRRHRADRITGALPSRANRIGRADAYIR